MWLRVVLAAAALPLCFALAFAATIRAQPAAAEVAREIIVYRGATLIDGTGAPPRANVSIVVDGAKIATVENGNDAVPEGAKIVDVRGLYVLPGLIDTHVHLATPPNRVMAEAIMRRQVFSGITAVRDMADDLRSIGELTRASLVGELPGPDIYYAALMAGPSFFTDPRTIEVAQGAVPGKVPWMQEVTDQTDLSLAVAMARGTYATGIKIYANLPASLVSKIADEARRQGVLVWAHAAVFPTLPAAVIDADVDVMSHVCDLAYQVSDVKPGSYQEMVPVDLKPFAKGDNPIVAELFRKMKRKGIILDATSRIYIEDEKRRKAAGSGQRRHCPSELVARLTRQAFAEGVMISSGTDGITDWNEAYPALHEELDILAKRVGMPSLEVIRAATETAAKTIGKEKEMGTIAPGKLANLVFVERDPLVDISNLRSVRFTVKRGRVYERRDYKPIAADEFGMPVE